jgi:UDP-glucose 4-epimerase
MNVVVTGGAGFIGSNLVAALVGRGDRVVVLDNFSTGHAEFLDAVGAGGELEVVTCDLFADAARLPALFDGADAVVHLAANADVRFGLNHPRRDLEQNVVVTHSVLEAMRIAAVPEIIFSSTGSVYGEASVFPTPEDAPFPVQTSLYGASKLAAEGFIASYCEGFGLAATVFRFVSILGRHYSHGHVIDFVSQLTRDPDELTILGDGRQRKSYLAVSDCVAAVLGRLGASESYEVFNLGVEDFCTVDESASWIAARMGLNPRRTYTGGDRGWVGDNPFILLGTEKIRATGWQPRYSIREAVESTVDYLQDNRWLLAREANVAGTVGG